MFFLLPPAVIHQVLHTERGLSGRQLVEGIHLEFASLSPSLKIFPTGLPCGQRALYVPDRNRDAPRTLLVFFYELRKPVNPRPQTEHCL